MAGAGFKTFNTGDVLTASDVNTYLMQQTVMVFADASARSTALGANVAEGMLSYLKDTNQVEVYNGSTWVSSDDPNAIQNTIVDAKGDLISATAADTPARLAVGSNNQILMADNTQSTGLKWVGDWTTYTPTWTGSITNPTIGNGTLSARYLLIGKICFVQIFLKAGSTTTFGSGTYAFSLPFTSYSYPQSFPEGLGTFYLEDSGVAGYTGFVTWNSTTTIICRVVTNNPFGSTAPFTFGNNDSIGMTFAYEVA